MKEWHKLLLIAAIFLGAYYIPWDSVIIRRSGLEAFLMLQDYARQHVLTCLVPAFFIAGAISTFVSQAAVLKYFGAQANKILSYSVASVSGSVLAVCSCTVLPLFAGIYTRGAGIGPATAFLYSGPAINVLAIILTAKVLGWQLGLARAIGAVIFAVVTGLLMAFIFRKDDAGRKTGDLVLPEDYHSRPLWQDALYMLTMVLILVSASFARPTADDGAVWKFIFSVKWYLAVLFLIILAVMLKKWFVKEELKGWVEATWGFSKQIMPLLLGGVLVAGFLLGRPGYPALIPETAVQILVGGNSLGANFFASIVGAFMYFATLTEVPILQGLI
ncbi:MAG: permease, partial [Smithellaceae bacterium]